MELDTALQPGYKVWGYKNKFAKGFLAAPDPLPALIHERWHRQSLGGLHFQIDPELPMERALLPGAASEAGTPAGVMVLGYAWDELDRREGIAARLCELVDSPSQLAETLTWLSGRFLVFIQNRERLTVYSDPLATRSLYYSCSPRGVTLASHTELISRAAGGLASTEARGLLGDPRYQDRAGRWLPALITTHDGVDQLYANHRLVIDGGTARQERFFPRTERIGMPLEAAAQEVRTEIARQVANWSTVARTQVLTLTAGADSEAILTSALSSLQSSNALALTYHSFAKDLPYTKADLLTANARAASAGMRHLIVDLPGRLSQAFADLYETTFPVWARHASLAAGLYLYAPARATTLFGIGGAILTSMWATRTATEPTPEILAGKFTRSEIATDPDLLRRFAEWMDVTDFSNETLRGYDFHDFFHWEHRMTKWAGFGYAEFDLCTIPAPVFSSRRLLVAGLSIPLEQRMDKSIYRVIRESQPPAVVPSGTRAFWRRALGRWGTR